MDCLCFVRTGFLGLFLFRSDLFLFLDDSFLGPIVLLVSQRGGVFDYVFITAPLSAFSHVYAFLLSWCT